MVTDFAINMSVHSTASAHLLGCSQFRLEEEHAELEACWSGAMRDVK